MSEREPIQIEMMSDSVLRKHWRHLKRSRHPEEAQAREAIKEEILRRAAIPQQEPAGDGETIEALRQGFNAMVQKGWDHDARIVARHIESLRARVQPRRVSRELLEEALSVWEQQGIRTLDDFAAHVGIEITPTEEDDVD